MQTVTDPSQKESTSILTRLSKFITIDQLEQFVCTLEFMTAPPATGYGELRLTIKDFKVSDITISEIQTYHHRRKGDN